MERHPVGGGPNPFCLPRSTEMETAMGNPRAIRRVLESRVDDRALKHWDAAFQCEPQAHRLLVVREKQVAESAGGIVIPESVKEKMNAGWVVAAGALVGSLQDSRPPGPLSYSPEEAIGLAIVFATHGLSDLFFDERDAFYDTPFGVIDEYQIFCVDRAKCLWAVDIAREAREVPL